MSTALSEAPALGLSASQRLHLEINGYVLLENYIDLGLVGRMRTKLFELEQLVKRGGPLPPGMGAPDPRNDHFTVINIAQVDPSFLEYVTHPGILAMARDVVGYDVRLHTSDAQIRRSGARTYRHYFHRDNNTREEYVHGLYRFQWIKILTALSDVGPDDGGTCVIAGSHKLSRELDIEDVVAAAEADPRLIHQVVAPKGSTLVFFESLLHTSGINRSGRPRSLVIAGYLPVHTKPDKDFTVPPEFVATVAPEHHKLLSYDPGPPAPHFQPFPRRQRQVTLLERELEKGPPPSEVQHGRIRITRAAFGVDGATVDVMPLIRLISAGQQVLISYLTAGDPAPQVVKSTFLEWQTTSGERRSKVFEEGENIDLDQL